MLEFKRTLTKEECELFDCDPIDWINKAIDGKLNKRKKRMVKTLLLKNIDEAVKLFQKLEKKNDSGS